MDDTQLLKSIRDSLAAVVRQEILYSPLSIAHTILDDLWTTAKEVADRPTVLYSRGAILEDTPRYSRTLEVPRKRPPPWYVGMTDKFKDDVQHMDKKLQGRIFEAITKITERPTTIHGDTVKPLSGELSGCWRYRIGDFRLIYSPDMKTGDITLLAFAPRGSAYID